MATNYLQGVNVGNGVADAYFRAGQVAKDVGNSFREKELVDYKIQLAAQEREDRLAQQAIDNKRAEAMLAMQQNQEQRAIDALAKTDRTQVATAEYNDRLAKVASGEQLDEQANENIRKAFATGGEKAVLSTLAKEKEAIKADPNRLKAMLGTTTYGDASTYDPVTGQLVGGGTVDTTGMINLQNKVLEGQQGQIDILNKQKFDKEILKEQFKNNKEVAGMKIAADIALEDKRNFNENQRLEKTIAKETAKVLLSPENKKLQSYKIAIATKELAAQTPDIKKRYGTNVKAYLTDRNDAIDRRARDELLNPKAGDFSKWTSGTGNPDEVNTFIGTLQNAGATNTEIQQALSAAPLGSGILDVGLPELDTSVAMKYFNTMAR